MRVHPPNTVSFMSAIPSTSGRLHSEFVRLLFLQGHRETDRFFSDSGVPLAQTDRGQFHFRRSAFVSQLKNRVDLTLVKAEALRITLNLDGTPITSKSHTHPSHLQTCNNDSKEQVFVCMASGVKFNDCSSRGNDFQNYSKNWFVFFEENYFSLSVQC